MTRLLKQPQSYQWNEWIRSLDYIVTEYFQLPPLMDGHDEAKSRIADPGLSFLRNLCFCLEEWELSGDHRFRAIQLADRAVENDISIPGLSPIRLHDEKAAAKCIGNAMAKVFRKAADGTVSIERHTVQRFIEQYEREDGKGNHDVKVYKFSRSEPESPTTPTSIQKSLDFRVNP